MLNLILNTAYNALLPDILASSIGFLFCVALTGLSTGNHKLNEKELKLYHDIARTNWKRMKIRMVAKAMIFGLVLYLEWNGKLDE